MGCEHKFDSRVIALKYDNIRITVSFSAHTLYNNGIPYRNGCIWHRPTFPTSGLVKGGGISGGHSIVCSIFLPGSSGDPTFLCFFSLCLSWFFHFFSVVFGHFSLLFWYFNFISSLPVCPVVHETSVPGVDGMVISISMDPLFWHLSWDPTSKSDCQYHFDSRSTLPKEAMTFT